jgi:hypothetical protein
MTRGSDMGDVIELNDGYPFTVTAMRVVRTGENANGYPVYEPTPGVGWSLNDSLAWMAGVAELELDAPVEIHRTSMRAACRYRLQVGPLQPITGLTATRVLDILGGCLTATTLLQGLLT